MHEGDEGGGCVPQFVCAVVLSKVFSLLMWSSTSAQKRVIWREGNFTYSQARHTKLCSHSPDPTYNTNSCLARTDYNPVRIKL